MELLHQLGIEPILFLAQLVNFLIVLFVLYVFVYKPVIKILDARKITVEKSLKDAQIVEENVKKANEKAQEILNDARKQAETIVTRTKQMASEERQAFMEQTKKEIEDITKKHQKQMQEKKEEMLAQIRSEAVDMTIFALAQIADSSLTKQVDEKHIKKILKQL